MTTAKKNILWIFGDQHRGQALSCNGDPNLDTPHIDRLADEGVNFERAVCGFPLCCPFRGSLLTGRYPHECVPGHEYRMPPDMPTIAHAFNKSGYETVYFGKWHVDGWHERDGRAAMHYVPPERRGGFGTWLGYDNNNCQWDSWLHGHDRAGKQVSHYRLPGFETDALTDILIDFIRTKGEEKQPGIYRPFFAVLSVQPPHDPYVAPAEFMARHNPARLQLRPNVPSIPRIEQRARREFAGACAQIENIDWNVGRIRDALAEAGLDHDTYIIFFSDHGDMHGSHGQFRKTSPWEESIRIPFIIGGLPTRYEHRQGRVSHLINHVDIAPTTLGLCGIEKPADMAGQDFSHVYLRDGSPPKAPDSAYLQSVIATRHHCSIDRPWRGVVTSDNWKYIALEHQPWLMFNLNEDPYELANLAHDTMFATQRKRLHDRLAQWIADTKDTFALPNLD
ncbi:MAG: sulfatase [Sedimentisphaerales bacterium]|nr:sulfatase [Sedimentisphaerales bacterium]